VCACQLGDSSTLEVHVCACLSKLHMVVVFKLVGLGSSFRDLPTILLATNYSVSDDFRHFALSKHHNTH
jgi:hypothetical protein